MGTGAHGRRARGARQPRPAARWCSWPRKPAGEQRRPHRRLGDPRSGHELMLDELALAADDPALGREPQGDRRARPRNLDVQAVHERARPPPRRADAGAARHRRARLGGRAASTPTTSRSRAAGSRPRRPPSTAAPPRSSATSSPSACCGCRLQTDFSCAAPFVVRSGRERGRDELGPGMGVSCARGLRRVRQRRARRTTARSRRRARAPVVAAGRVRARSCSASSRGPRRMSSRRACASTAPTWGSATTTAGGRSSRSATRGPTRSSSATTTRRTTTTPWPRCPRRYAGDVPVLDYVTHSVSPLDLQDDPGDPRRHVARDGLRQDAADPVERQPQRVRHVRPRRLDALRCRRRVPRRRRVHLRARHRRVHPGLLGHAAASAIPPRASRASLAQQCVPEPARLLRRHEQLAVRRQSARRCAPRWCRGSSSRCSARMTSPASTRCWCTARTSSATRPRAPVKRFTGTLRGQRLPHRRRASCSCGAGPGFVGEQEREAQLYLLTHALPIEIDAGGQLRVGAAILRGARPAQRRAALVEAAGRRRSRSRSTARPSGDPHEEIGIVAADDDQLARARRSTAGS